MKKNNSENTARIGNIYLKKRDNYMTYYWMCSGGFLPTIRFKIYKQSGNKKMATDSS